MLGTQSPAALCVVIPGTALPPFCEFFSIDKASKGSFCYLVYYVVGYVIDWMKSHDTHQSASADWSKKSL